MDKLLQKGLVRIREKNLKFNKPRKISSTIKLKKSIRKTHWLLDGVVIHHCRVSVATMARKLQNDVLNKGLLNSSIN